MTNERKALTIHFNDGSSIGFDFPTQTAETHSLASRMENLLKQQHLLIEAEGALLLYPLYNVRSVQVYPAPDTLPDHCIRGARISS